MTSDELNEAIASVEEGRVGKPIPYIGWFWRTVEFDMPNWGWGARGYRFGIVPEGTGDFLTAPSSAAYVGFMENNKWGYKYSLPLTEADCATLRALLEVAVTEKTNAAFGAVKDFMEKFIPEQVTS